MAIYMKFGAIEGGVTTKGFEKWIEVTSFQYGVGRGVGSPAGGGKRESSNPSVSEISVTKPQDVSSAALYQDALSGTFNTKVDVSFSSSSKDQVDTFLSYELTDCGVSGFSLSSGGDNPIESLSLNFAKIMMTPSPLDKAGVPQKGSVVTYDLATLTTS